MRLVECVPAAFILVLAGGVAIGTRGLNLWDGPTPGARFFPMTIAIAGTAVALALLWAQWRGFERVEVDFPTRLGATRVGATILALIALAAGTPLVGLVPMVAAFVAVMLIVVLRQRIPISLFATAIVAGFIHFVFVRWLSVPLPMPFGI
jgi:hypothetical protein